MVSVSQTTKTLNGLITGSFDSASVSSLTVGTLTATTSSSLASASCTSCSCTGALSAGSLSVSGTSALAGVTCTSCSCSGALSCSGVVSLTGSVTTSGAVQILNSFKFNGSQYTNSGQGVYLTMNGPSGGGGIPVIVLSSATTNNRYIQFANASGTQLASVESWGNSTSTSDLRFYTNGSTLRLQINSTGFNVYQNVNVTSGSTYRINSTDVLSATTLGSGVVNSSLTSVGTLGSLAVTNGITASTLTGTLQTASQPLITTVGTLGSLAVTGGVTASTLTGSIQTASQPLITTEGTLGSLAVTGGVTASTLTGSIQTASQPLITTVGTLGSLAVTGGVTASTLTGSIQTASQPLITTVGTLGSLSVTGGVTASTLTGAIQTASQPLITTVGTLGSLSVSGNMTSSGYVRVAGIISDATQLRQGLNMAWDSTSGVGCSTLMNNSGGATNGGVLLYNQPTDNSLASTKTLLASFRANGTNLYQSTSVLSLSSSGTVTCPYMSVTSSGLVSGLLTTGSLTSSGVVTTTTVISPANLTLTATATSTTYSYPTTSLTSNSYLGYTITASQNSSTGYYAYDGNSGTSWDSANYNTSGTYIGSTTTLDVSGVTHTGDWIQIAYPVSVKVTYALNRGGNYAGCQTAQLLGSNDGTNWRKIGTIPAFSWTIDSSSGGELYLSSNTLYFQFYRLVFTAGGGFLGLTLRSSMLSGIPAPTVQCAGSMSVTDSAIISSSLSAGSTLLSSLVVSGATALSSTLSAGASTLSSLAVSGATTLSSTLSAGASTLSSLTVSGATTLTNNLAVSGGTIQFNGSINEASTATQGSFISWNNSSVGDGSTDFYNKGGTGANGQGFKFINSTGSGTAMTTNKTLIASMTTSGTAFFGKLSSSGPLTATTGTFSSSVSATSASFSSSLSCAAATCSSLQCNGDLTATGYILCKPIAQLMVYNSSFSVNSNADICRAAISAGATITGNPYSALYGWKSTAGFFFPLDGVIQFTITFRMSDGSGDLGIMPRLSTSNILPNDGTYWVESDPGNRRNTCYTIVVNATQGQTFDIKLNAGATQSFQYIRAHALYIST